MLRITPTIVFGAAVCCAALAAAWAQQATVPAAGAGASLRPKITVGKETTRATGPLREDGTVDYVASLNQQLAAGVTPDNNATVALLRIFGPKAFGYDPQKTKQLWSKLGIEPLPDEGPYFVGPDEFAEQHAGANDDLQAIKDKQSDYYSRPWTAADAPLLAQWLKSQGAHVDAMAAAARLPAMWTPLVPSVDSIVMTSISGNGLNACRAAANAMACRASFRIAAGDLDGFQSDVEACRRLARLVRRRPTLVDHLVAFGIDALATATVRNAATSELLTAPQAKALLADLDRVVALPAPYEAVDVGERYLMLDFMTLAAREGWVKAARILSGEKADRMLFTGKQNKDWDAILKRINRRYDRIVNAMRLPTFAERRTAMSAIDRELGEERVRLGGGGGKNPLAFLMPIEDRMMMLLTPSLSRTVDLAERAAVENDLARIALALAAYHAETKAYPARLDEIIPARLPKIPTDPFAAGNPPLNYERNALGGYRVTSVGVNGKDERERLDQNYGADDIVVTAGKQPEPATPHVDENEPDGEPPADDSL